jgi:nuclear pore complex protein Nup205
MLRAISEGEECAASAHKFLMEEGQMVTSRLRRSSSLSWAQIFAELQFMLRKFETVPLPFSLVLAHVGKPMTDEIDEPESAMMLECTCG